MELCTGGSLYEVIDSPENAFGLDEAQFKQLIYDVGEFVSNDRLCLYQYSGQYMYGDLKYNGWLHSFV